MQFRTLSWGTRAYRQHAHPHDEADQELVRSSTVCVLLKLTAVPKAMERPISCFRSIYEPEYVQEKHLKTKVHPEAAEEQETGEQSPKLRHLVLHQYTFDNNTPQTFLKSFSTKNISQMVKRNQRCNPRQARQLQSCIPV